MADQPAMTAAIWSGAGMAADVLLLAAAVTAAIAIALHLTGRPADPVLQAAAILLLALGLLAL
jgi:hypothetical protein